MRIRKAAEEEQYNDAAYNTRDYMGGAKSAKQLSNTINYKQSTAAGTNTYGTRTNMSQARIGLNGGLDKSGYGSNTMTATGRHNRTNRQGQD